MSFVTDRSSLAGMVGEGGGGGKNIGKYPLAPVLGFLTTAASSKAKCLLQSAAFFRMVPIHYITGNCKADELPWTCTSPLTTAEWEKIGAPFDSWGSLLECWASDHFSET